MNELNRYRLVHKVSNHAKKEEINSRNMLKKDDYVSVIGKTKEKRNFVKESYDEIVLGIPNPHATIQKNASSEDETLEQ